MTKMLCDLAPPFLVVTGLLLLVRGWQITRAAWRQETPGGRADVRPFARAPMRRPLAAPTRATPPSALAAPALKSPPRTTPPSALAAPAPPTPPAIVPPAAPTANRLPRAALVLQAAGEESSEATVVDSLAAVRSLLQTPPEDRTAPVTATPVHSDHSEATVIDSYASMRARLPIR